IIAKVGQDHSALHGLSAWLVHFTALLPALIGIGLGRNPSGFLDDSFARYRAMIREAKGVLVAAAGAELVVWFLAFRHTISNWTFAIATAALLLVLPQLVSVVAPSAYGRRRTVDHERDATPLELIGIDRAFTADDLREIGRGLGLDPALDHGGDRGGESMRA
ncbi:MAG: branched-chain amino acid transport system permease protein livM, partial [Actinomycetota bacterium]|nr:branched-chain amino acid transport system permease protein livM [Actinomycetota bacterium]